MCADFDCEDWEKNSLNDDPDSDTGDTEEVDYDLLPPPHPTIMF